MVGRRVFHLTLSALILGFNLLKNHTMANFVGTASYIIEAYFLHQNLKFDISYNLFAIRKRGYTVIWLLILQ